MSETESANIEEVVQEITEQPVITQTPSKRKSVSPSDEVLITPGKRERKQANFFQLETPIKHIISSATKKEGVNGTGKPLGEFDHFNTNISKFTSDDEILQHIFQICFNCRGRRVEIKRLLRQFNGFESNLIDSRIEKVTEKSFWTVKALNSALDLLGLEKGGDRPTKISRLINFLAHPNDDAISSRSTRKTKKSKSKSDKPRKLSPYLLFANEHRQAVKDQNPDFKFGDVGRKLGSMWAELSEEERNVWVEKANQVEEEEEEEEENEEEEEEENEEEIDEEEEPKKKKSRNSISPSTPNKTPQTPSKAKTPAKTPSKTPNKTPSKSPSKTPKKTPSKVKAEENLDEQLDEIFNEDKEKEEA